RNPTSMPARGRRRGDRRRRIPRQRFRAPAPGQRGRTRNPGDLGASKPGARLASMTVRALAFPALLTAAAATLIREAVTRSGVGPIEYAVSALLVAGLLWV